jgi:hypothetical protein
MQVPAFPRADDAALLAGLAAGPGGTEPVVLDGRRLAYLVTGGSAELVAVPRSLGRVARRPSHPLTTIGPGAVMPSSTVLGAWQLVLAPEPGTLVRPLGTGRLRSIGYVDADDPQDPLVPAPRAVSTLVAALARAMDAALFALAEGLRVGRPPGGALAVGAGQVVSLAAGAAVTGDGGVGWLRVAGGHARRNGEHATVFGGAEPALLAGRDWITVDGPATVEALGTADLLRTGHLPAALDHHLLLTLRTIDHRVTDHGTPTLVDETGY